MQIVPSTAVVLRTWKSLAKSWYLFHNPHYKLCVPLVSSPWYSSSMPSKVLTTKTWWLWTAIILDLPQFITSHIFLSERAFHSDFFAYFLARDIWGFKACFINHIFLLFSSYIPSHPSSIKNFYFCKLQCSLKNFNFISAF